MPPKPLFTLTSARPPSAPLRPSPLTNPKKRRALADSDSEDDAPPASETISGFDTSGAVGTRAKPAPAAPLVIPKLANKDWRAEAARKKQKGIYVPTSNGGAPLKAEDLTEIVDHKNEVFGLTVFEKTEEREEVVKVEDETPAEPEKKMTEDERALAALLGEDKRRDDLVIASADDKDWRARPETEDDAYKRDVDSRPDVPSLDDYAAVPVEEFGAALLRGMGWKGGQGIDGKGGKKGVKKVERRPAFLGIGAKPQSEVPELGSWGKADKGKKGRRDLTYTPVVMIDKKTGKVVEESAVKGEGEKKAPEREREERRGGESSGREVARAPERERERDDRRHGGGRDRDDRRHGSERTSDRDRNRDRDDRRERDDRRTGGDRDRERDRDRGKDRERDRDRDKHRSRRDEPRRRSRSRSGSRDRDHHRRRRDRR